MRHPCLCHKNHIYLLHKSSRCSIMKRIILITGGSRSGKSTYAEKLALSLSPTPVYIATARIWDDDFRERVEQHQKRRGAEWINIEEEKELSRHRLAEKVVLIDCVTLWCTNFFFDMNSDTEQALAAAKEEFNRFTEQEATFIFVTNEIGMGGVSENKLQQKFTDMQGWMNQYIASRADEVILMVAGIPMQVKK
ncbi:adenosylcobinamide kinase /adenosylcobinamide-phosphate guanylyltransferase [Bacteroides heparinolyticus]|uniref:Adenosylcobinamide kinase n=1 Tax=Prevotella heparinolytica TaxID=28113 RepID=A0A4R2M1D7_9BACE|nr:adenosylcobinamide kinase /adenosylcobinamide-phosphate guanylyltransferase [Bacteroides heparinolyticus]